MSNSYEDPSLNHQINPDSKYWDISASSWVEQVDQLQKDAETKTALPDSNVVILANTFGLLPATLSAFAKITMSFEVILEETAPSIGDNIKLLLGDQSENLEIIYISVSGTLNNIRNQPEELIAETKEETTIFDKTDSDSVITAMTISSSSSSAVDTSDLINPSIEVIESNGDKHVCKNYRGEEYTFSDHALEHKGDGSLLCLASTYRERPSFCTHR